MGAPDKAARRWAMEAEADELADRLRALADLYEAAGLHGEEGELRHAALLAWSCTAEGRAEIAANRAGRA